MLCYIRWHIFNVIFYTSKSKDFSSALYLDHILTSKRYTRNANELAKSKPESVDLLWYNWKCIVEYTTDGINVKIWFGWFILRPQLSAR